ncbi:MAG: flagellar protein FlaG [Pseudomonadales bacterium]|jgi:flagellar protein FlaG|nr:flagellar protein FlaG [Pseudomonadales bacterium]
MSELGSMVPPAPSPEAALRWLTGRERAEVRSPGATDSSRSTERAAAMRQESGAKAVERAVESVERYVSDLARDLQFSVHESSGRTVITVTERGTQRVIRQIPSEEMLALAERIDSTLDQGGVLMRTRA